MGQGLYVAALIGIGLLLIAERIIRATEHANRPRLHVEPCPVCARPRTRRDCQPPGAVCAPCVDRITATAQETGHA